MSISARTTSRPEWRRREAAVRQLLELGEIDILERLRTRSDPLHIADVQRAVENGRIADLRRADGATDLSLAGALIRVIAAVEGSESAAATIHQYRVLERMLLAHFDATRPLWDIASSEWQDWLRSPKATNRDRVWSRARQKLALGMVARIYNDEIRREAERAHRTKTTPRIVLNPTAHVELPKLRSRRVEFLRPAEWRALSAGVEGRAVHALLGLGTLAGLRITEAAMLRTDIDVVLDGADPVIHVQPREGHEAWHPKSNRSVRDIPIGTELLRILRRHVELGFHGQRYFIRAEKSDRPVNRQVLAKWVRLAFETAGIRYGRERDALTFHSCRHTFISWLVQEDVSLMKIEMLAGTSVKMILDVYAHLINKDLRKAVGIVDAKAREKAP